MKTSSVRLLAIVLSSVMLAAVVPPAFAESATPVWLTAEDVPAGFAGSTATPAQLGLVPLPSLGLERQYAYFNSAGEMILGWTIAPRNPLVQSLVLSAMPTSNFDATAFQASGGGMILDMITDVLAQAGVPAGPAKGALPRPVADWEPVGERSGAVAMDVQVYGQLMTAELALIQRGPLVGGIQVMYPKGIKPSTGVTALAQKLDARYQAALKAGALAPTPAPSKVALEALDGATVSGFAVHKGDTSTVYTPQAWTELSVTIKTLGADAWLQMKPSDLVNLIFAALASSGVPVTPEMLASQGLDQATLEQTVTTAVETIEVMDSYAPSFIKLWAMDSASTTGINQMVLGQYATKAYGGPGDFVQLISDAATSTGVATMSLQSNMAIAGRPAANVTLDASAWGLPLQGSVYFIQDQEEGYIWTVVVFLTDHLERDAGTFDTVVRTLTIP
jgi:hypothetical protein